MRHRKSDRPLGRNSSHRKALFRNLVTSLLRHERIETTEAKGKELRSISDHMISLGMQGDLASRRAVLSYVQDPAVVARLFSKIAPLYKTTDSATPSPGSRGGYTRLIKTRIRYGDAAPMVIVELTRRTKPDEEDANAVVPVKAEAQKTEEVKEAKADKKAVAASAS